MRNTMLTLEEENAKLKKILSHLLADRTGVYFVCGEAGDKDTMGLPKRIYVCPSYGLDGFAVYEKVSEYSAPGY